MKALILIIILITANFAHAERLMIFAAASTTNAVNEIIKEFDNETGLKVTASYASSGTLAKQIDKNAPANLFLSANPKWLKWLQDKNKLEKGTAVNLLRNRLAIISAKDVTINDIPTKKLLTSAHRIAVADPAHSPAGIYAKSAIESLGIWDVVGKKLTRMQTVRVALAMVERSATPIGIVYSSDASSSKNIKTVRLIDESLHKPIIYPLAIIKGKSTANTKKFYKYLLSEKASDVFRKYGFQVK